MEQLSFEVINRIDMVDFLSTIGVEPKRIKAHCFYYISPLAGHPQHRTTFIVNHHLNRWRETTTRQAGTLADLAVRLYDCTIGELTTILRAALPPVLQSAAVAIKSAPPAIAIERTQPIRSTFLENFLWERRIPLDVAREYCVEAWYSHGNKTYAALALPNDAGGFELFDRYRRNRVQPSGPTHIRHGSNSLAVFRHALDLLTYVSFMSVPASRITDLLLLNAPVAFPVVQEMLAGYCEKHLFLPNDAAGILFSTQATRVFPESHDHRSMYAGYLTLSDWICHPGTAISPKIPCSSPNMPKSPKTDRRTPRKAKNTPPCISPQDEQM
jgi:hypothetical protein